MIRRRAECPVDTRGRAREPRAYASAPPRPADLVAQRLLHVRPGFLKAGGASGSTSPPLEPLLRLQALAGNSALGELLHDDGVAPGRIPARPTVQRCGARPCDCPAEEKALSVQRELACDEETGECSEVAVATGVGEQFTSSGLDATPGAASGVGSTVEGVAGPQATGAGDQFTSSGPDAAPGAASGVGSTVEGVAGSQATEAGDQFTSSGPDAAPGVASGVGSEVQDVAAAELESFTGGPLGPPTAVPEKEDAACPPYTDEEKQPRVGQHLDFGQGGEGPASALLFDFTPGSSRPGPEHHVFLKETVDRFNLGDPSAPVEKITVIEGFTDCVGFSAGKEASKNINASIRLQRAIAVKIALLDAGARSVNVEAEPRASGARGGPGDDSTVEGRALNRSVRIALERKAAPPPEPPGPPDTGPGPPLCKWGGPASKRWELTSHVSASLGKEGEPLGGTVTGFHLKDLDSGKRFIATFGPAVSGGLSGLPVEVQISIPSATPFETPDGPVCPSDFDGPATIVTKFSVTAPPPLPPVGRMEGDIILDLKTDPPGIDIGSFQVGTPAASASIALGPFLVFESVPF